MKNLLFIFLLFLSGCDFFNDNTTITLKLNQLPVHWISSFPDLQFLVIYPDKNNRIIRKYFPAETEKIHIESDKMGILPVTVYTVTASCIFPPSGAVFPYGSNGAETIELNWESGITAEIFILLISGGMNMKIFNTERLYNEIIQKAPPDPFKIDKQNIIDSILSGYFRVTDIKVLVEREIKIDLYKGIWFTESPFSELYDIENPCEKTISFTYGFHLLYNSDTKDFYYIYIDEKNIVIEFHEK